MEVENKKVLFFPSLVWAVILLILSGLPKSSLPSISFDSFFELDKIAHFLMYGIFAFLLFRDFGRSHFLSKVNNQFIFSVLGASFFGFCMELMQFSVFSGRYFEIMDLIANIIGAFVGAIVLLILKRKKIWIFH